MASQKTAATETTSGMVVFAYLVGSRNVMCSVCKECKSTSWDWIHAEFSELNLNLYEKNYECYITVSVNQPSFVKISFNCSPHFSGLMLFFAVR